MTHWINVEIVLELFCMPILRRFGIKMMEIKLGRLGFVKGRLGTRINKFRNKLLQVVIDSKCCLCYTFDPFINNYYFTSDLCKNCDKNKYYHIKKIDFDNRHNFITKQNEDIKFVVIMELLCDVPFDVKLSIFRQFFKIICL